MNRSNNIRSCTAVCSMDNGAPMRHIQEMQACKRYNLQFKGKGRRHCALEISAPLARLSVRQGMEQYLAHRWLVKKIVELLYKEETEDCGQPRATAALGQTCHAFYDLCMNTIWQQQTDLIPLFKCLPKDAWVIKYSKLRGRGNDIRWDGGTMVGVKLQRLTVGIHQGYPLGIQESAR